MVGLDDDKKRILKEYSKGMRQRIGLAQALINDPELVILDEPTSGLDPLGTRWMKDLILDLRDKGKTIIMCSHRLEDVQDVCDRIAILNDGELQELGERQDAAARTPTALELRASGVPAQRRPAPRPRGGAANGTAASSTVIGHPTTTLEDLFLRIVEESKAHPGRRYLPATERRGPDGTAAAATDAAIRNNRAVLRLLVVSRGTGRPYCPCRPCRPCKHGCANENHPTPTASIGRRPRMFAALVISQPA